MEKDTEKSRKKKKVLEIIGIVLLCVLLIPLALYALQQIIALAFGLFVLIPMLLFPGKGGIPRGRHWWR